MQAIHPLTIIDGGMGQELLDRDPRGRTGLWSAKALLQAPELVEQVHSDYIASGAQVIITNTYSTVPSYLSKEGLADCFLELADQAGRIARRVADAAPHRVVVAGSIPPLDESYRADLAPPAEEAKPIYRELAGALDPHVDLFVCETMSSVQEACNATSVAREVGGPDKPVWVSWTLAEEAGTGLRSNETVAEAFAAVQEYQPDSYLFNCTSPEAISVGLQELSAMTDKPLGAYPNRLIIPAGWTLDGDIKASMRDMTTEEFLGFCAQWRELGASMIGGCCGIGPQMIAALRDAA
ncbi:MAG: homocysteine S-methyltransferase family protein [Pseudomonadota bacterium]